jgi:hypothetical protein
VEEGSHMLGVSHYSACASRGLGPAQQDVRHAGTVTIGESCPRFVTSRGWPLDVLQLMIATVESGRVALSAASADGRQLHIGPTDGTVTRRTERT